MVGGASFSAKATGDVLPRFEKLVEINKSVVDVYDIPVLHFVCKYTDNEFEMMKQSVATPAEVCRRAGFEVIHTNDKPFPPGHRIHEPGSCRMVNDARRSVLNGYNQSHDIKHLFVVNGSSFVTAGTQNQATTICALAMRASEYLADQLSKKEL